ncbi:hypothetical protein FRC09_019738 [Ceratobasidium sp. 395]|nr:hypothetical protein FRC09_019738 [Ceratobasidium sp. 395]
MTIKTLNFYSYNLQKDRSVVLFRPLATDKLFKNQFPVVRITVKYAARLAFGYAQTDADNLVDSGTWTEVRSGEMTGNQGDAGEKRFGGITKREGTKLLVCKSNSSGRADLSIGFVKGDGIDQRFEPTLVWTGVGAKSNITAQFTPVLRAYLLLGKIETDEIWCQNINELDDVAGWNFEEDDANGGFSITPARGA